MILFISDRTEGTEAGRGTNQTHQVNNCWDFRGHPRCTGASIDGHNCRLKLVGLEEKLCTDCRYNNKPLGSFRQEFRKPIAIFRLVVSFFCCLWGPVRKCAVPRVRSSISQRVIGLWRFRLRRGGMSEKNEPNAKNRRLRTWECTGSGYSPMTPKCQNSKYSTCNSVVLLQPFLLSEPAAVYTGQIPIECGSRIRLTRR